MQVTIKYNDDTSFTVEEIVKQAVHNYGKKAEVRVMPDGLAPHDLIYFALQCILTHSQLGMLFNNKFSYQTDLKTLRAETLYKLGEILDQVLVDNEAKVV